MHLNPVQLFSQPGGATLATLMRTFECTDKQARNIVDRVKRQQRKRGRDLVLVAPKTWEIKF